jgi:uncharacterized membrane protein (DUF485 family)
MSPRIIYYAVAAAVAAVWTLYMELLGPGGPEYLLPIPLFFIAVAAGSAASPRLSEKLLRSATALCEKAGLKRIPYDVSEEMAVHLASAAALAAAIAAAVVYTLLLAGPGTHAMLASLAAAPLSVAGMHQLLLRSRVSERREKTEWELPFFAIYSSILAHCGLTLYASMKLLTKTGRRLFSQMSQESEDVQRMAELTGRGVIESLEVHASSHPNEGFQSLVYAATSVWRMGGSMVSVLEDRATELLKSLEEKYDRFATTVSAVMEAFIILLLLLPMGIVLIAVTSPAQAAPLVTFMTVGLIPMVGMLMYFFVRSKSPKHLDDIKLTPKAIALGVAMAAATLPPLILAKAPMTLMFTIPVAAACVGVYIQMRPVIKELKACDAEARRWLKDVTEFRRLGNPPSTAIFKTAGHRYAPEFKKILDAVVARMSMGLTIWEAGAGMARSWLLRIALFLLHSINLSGGGSPYLMERLVELLRSYSLAKEKMVGRISPFKWLALAMPLITAVTIGLVLPIANLGSAFQISGGGEAVAGGAGAGLGIMQVSPEEMMAMADAGMVMIAVGTLFYMLIIGRAVDGHPYNMLRIAVAMLVTAASYYAIAPVGDAMMGIFRYG